MRLKNKVCAITGAGRGIGRASAKLFAQEGAQVFILEFDGLSGKAAVEEIVQAGNQAIFVQCDVSNESSVKNAFEFIEKSAHEFPERHHCRHFDAAVGIGLAAGGLGLVVVEHLHERAQTLWRSL